MRTSTLLVIFVLCLACISARSVCDDCDDDDCETECCETRRCYTRRCRTDCRRSCKNNDDSNRISQNETNEIRDLKAVVIVDNPVPNITTINTNNVNLTTHIIIDNVVHNYNNISIPIYINTTNINHIHSEYPDSAWSNDTITNNNNNMNTTNCINNINHQILVNCTRDVVKKIEEIPPINSTIKKNNTIIVQRNETYWEEPPQNCNRVVIKKDCITSNFKITCKRYWQTICRNDEQIIDTDVNNCNYNPRENPYLICNNGLNCQHCFDCGFGYNPRQCTFQPRCESQCRQIIRECNNAEFNDYY